MVVVILGRRRRWGGARGSGARARTLSSLCFPPFYLAQVDLVTLSASFVCVYLRDRASLNGTLIRPQKSGTETVGSGAREEITFTQHLGLQHFSGVLSYAVEGDWLHIFSFCCFPLLLHRLSACVPASPTPWFCSVSLASTVSGNPLAPCALLHARQWCCMYTDNGGGGAHGHLWPLVGDHVPLIGDLEGASHPFLTSAPSPVAHAPRVCVCLPLRQTLTS